MESATLEVTDEIIVQLDPNQARIADAYLRELARIIVLMGARGGGKSADLRAIILFAPLKRNCKPYTPASQRATRSTNLIKSPRIQRRKSFFCATPKLSRSPRSQYRLSAGRTAAKLYFGLSKINAASWARIPAL